MSKHLLLVEDNPADAELVRVGLDESSIPTKLSVVQNGEEALAFVRRQAPYTEAERPDLILLDLNLPKIDGRQVLRELKADPAYKQIPIVVLTSSVAPGDVQKAYEMHANSYVKKQVDLDEFMRVIHSFESFWLEIAKLP
ncbi:MAG: response regulator [Cyanobacteria bacterium NC_groundwater_1444_Ag_S-0.65um_54_12]|nr:response regulator [Cyanobacteria bacterium NC_groundwater_1444_Ag_S-0.65um_54_12]